jgi:hypothetical protein
VVNTSFYVLRRVYSDLFSDPPAYKWAIGLTNNTCAPVWQMMNGLGNANWPNFSLTLHG